MSSIRQWVLRFLLGYLLKPSTNSKKVPRPFIFTSFLPTIPGECLLFVSPYSSPLLWRRRLLSPTPKNIIEIINRTSFSFFGIGYVRWLVSLTRFRGHHERRFPFPRRYRELGWHYLTQLGQWEIVIFLNQPLNIQADWYRRINRLQIENQKIIVL